MFNKSFLIVFILFFAAGNIFPQQSRLSKGVNYISEYVASDYFSSISKTNTPLALVDSIYLRALKFNNNNVSETLLSLTFGLIPYNVVPLKMPVLGFIINYRLTSANDSVYRKKNDNLPAYLFLDTPQDRFGDKDKLAHFFGNAFLSYSQSVFDLTDLIGYFVECFEDAFKVQSSIDFRDMKANGLGKEFGNRLKKDKNILPSEIMLNKSLK